MTLNQNKLSQWVSIVIIIMIVWVWAQMFLDKKSDFNNNSGNGVTE